MIRKRRSFSAADKAAAFRKRLVNKTPVSQIADQMQVQPTLIHNWVNRQAISQPSKQLSEQLTCPVLRIGFGA